MSLISLANINQMMEKLIENFPNQLSEALKHARALAIPQLNRTFKNVYFAGVGGSAISGDIARDLLRETCKIPFHVGRSYKIPAYVDEHTLFIATSYSGNTEETLSALEYAKERGCCVVCISSAGQLSMEKSEGNMFSIKLPAKEMVPRAQIGYPLVHLLYVLVKFGLAPESLLANIQSSVDLINFDQDDIKKRAQILANELKDKMSIIYTTDRMESIAVRLRQQINENAKRLCWHHVIPEMNHNEVLGWHQTVKDSAVIFLRNKDDFKRNAVRIDITKKLVSQHSDTVIEVFSKGNSMLEKMIYFIHLGDWTSLYMSINNKVDAISIESIDYLKAQLNKL